MGKFLDRALVFALTLFGYSCLHAMRTSWSYTKKQFIKEGSHVYVTKDHLGYVDITFILCYSFGLAFIGPLGDKINRRYFLSIGYIVCSLAFMVFPASCIFFDQSHYAILLVFMAIKGLFESVGMPGSMGVLFNWFSKKNRGLVVGFWAGCCNYGNIYGLISSTIITQFIGARWEYNFFFNGLCAFGMALMILLFLKPDKQKEHSFLTQNIEVASLQIQQQSQTSTVIQEKKKKISFFTAFLIPRVPEYVIAYSCLKASVYGLLFWLPLFIKENGMESSSGYIPSMTDAVTFFGGILIGQLGEKWPRTFFLAPFMYLSAAMMMVVKIFLSNDPLPYYFVIFLMGFGLGGPYNIIGTVISIDLGTHKSLRGDKEAISTVTGVIDGCGALFSGLTQLILAYLSKEIIFYLFTGYTFVGATALVPIMVRDFEQYQLQKQNRAQYPRTRRNINETFTMTEDSFLLYFEHECSRWIFFLD